MACPESDRMTGNEPEVIQSGCMKQIQGIKFYVNDIKVLPVSRRSSMGSNKTLPPLMSKGSGYGRRLSKSLKSSVLFSVSQLKLGIKHLKNNENRSHATNSREGERSAESKGKQLGEMRKTFTPKGEPLLFTEINNLNAESRQNESSSMNIINNGDISSRNSALNGGITSRTVAKRQGEGNELPLIPSFTKETIESPEEKPKKAEAVQETPLKKDSIQENGHQVKELQDASTRKQSQSQSILSSPMKETQGPSPKKDFQVDVPAKDLQSYGGSPKSSLLSSNKKLEKPKRSRKATMSMSNFSPNITDCLPRKRKRVFDVKLSEKVNLFEGYPCVQYDTMTRKDPEMQKVIFRDQLLVLIDKLFQFKLKLAEQNKLKHVRTLSMFHIKLLLLFLGLV